MKKNTKEFRRTVFQFTKNSASRVHFYDYGNREAALVVSRRRGVNVLFLSIDCGMLTVDGDKTYLKFLLKEFEDEDGQ